MANTLQTVVGNTAPQYQITCQRPDGTVIDLTNCTVSHYLYLNKVQTNTGHEASSVTILNATSGIIGWKPATGDFATKGNYKGNVIIVYADTSVEVLYNQTAFQVRNLVQ